MIYIISGTNRIDSNTFKISKILEQEYKTLGVPTEVIDLKELPFDELHATNYGKNIPQKIGDVIQKLNTAEGFHIVCPEYNGSYPGILKYFIDHFSYPTTFEHRPVAFTGLGGRWGGLRPIEHLQGVFGYRNSYVFPQRVFISNVWEILKDNRMTDEFVMNLMKSQVVGFSKFVKALKSEGLDANSILKNNPIK